MRPLIFRVVLVIAFLATTAWAAPTKQSKSTQMNIQSVANLAVPTILSIQAKTKTGWSEKTNGVLISNNGYFVCTDHLLVKQRVLWVHATGWPKPKKAEFICRDPGSRLVLMRIASQGKKALPFTKISYLQTPTRGTPFILFSYYDGKSKVKWINGRVGSTFNPLHEANIKSSKLANFSALQLSGFHPICTGGPVLDGQAHFLGIASFFPQQMQKPKRNKLSKHIKDLKQYNGLVCYVIPTKWILAFCIAAADEKLTKFHGKDLKPLRKVLSEAEASLDFKAKIDFARTKAIVKKRILTLYENTINHQNKLFKAAFAKMSRKARKIHARHPKWHPTFVKYICKRKLKKGMTKAMVKEVFGNPKVKKSKTIDGQHFTEWLFHNRRAFGSITKGRSVVFNSNNQLVGWKHYRGNLQVK